MRNVVHAVIHEGEQSGFVGECGELHAVTQGATLDEVTGNLREAIALALDDGDAQCLGYVESPTVVVTMALAPVGA